MYPLAIHRLTPHEIGLLRAANSALTAITESHCHNCECELCEARMLTDTQDAASLCVPHIPAGNEAN